MRSLYIKAVSALAVLALSVSVHAVCVHAEPDGGVNISIRTMQNESVAVLAGRPIITSEPVVFVPDPDQETSYSISIDGENFGGSVPMEGKSVTLYPDDDTSPSGKWLIKFTAEIEGASAGSEIYRVVFDTKPPQIELTDPDVVASPLLHKEKIHIRLSDENGLSRIVAECGGTVIYEKHDLDGQSGYEIETELSDNGDGGGIVTVSAFDMAQNRSDLSFEYMIDLEDPTIRAEGAADGAHLAKNAHLNVTAEDNSGDVFIDYTVEKITKDATERMSVSNAEKNTVIELEDDGIYNISASAHDGAGRCSDTIMRKIVIDKSAPVINIQGAAEGVDQTSPAGLTIEVEDNIYEGSEVNITLTRRVFGIAENIRMDTYDLQAYKDIRAVNITSDGDYELSVAATDSAGNRSTASRSFRIDKIAPDVALFGLSEGQVTGEKPTVRFCAGEMFYDSTVMSAVLEKKEKDGYVTIQSSDKVMRQKQDLMDITVPDEGVYRLTCAASDRSGNSALSSLSFTVDHTPPVITIPDDVDNGFFRSFRLPVAIAKLVSDMTDVNVEAFVNDRRITDSDVIIEEGKYVLSVLAADEAGNESERDACFIVDHTAPQIVLSGFDRYGNIKKGSLVGVSLFDESDTLVSVRFNDRNVAVGSDNTASIAVDEYGRYKLAVVAKDDAGNVTDTEITTSCNMISPAFSGIVRNERTISAPEDTGDIDLGSLLVGLGTLLTGTFGLTWRAHMRS